MLSNLMVLTLLGLVSMAGAEPIEKTPLIDDAELQDAGMFKYWQAQLPISPGDSIETAYLEDEALYVVTDGGTFFAMAARTGLIRWAVKLAAADYRIFRPTHVRTIDGNGPVVVATTAKVFLYDRFSGDAIRDFTPPFAAGSSAVGYGGTLYMGSADGRFYSLEVSHPRADKPFKRWEATAGGPVTASPVLYGGNALLFASHAGLVFSCRAADKALNWVYRADGAIVGDPFVDESGVYLASMERSLYKLHAGTGRVLWRVRMSEPLSEGPVTVAHTVYQFCNGEGIIAIDADSGDEKWRLPEGRAFVAHAGGGDTILTSDRRIAVVDHETGELRHTLGTSALAGAVSNTVDDAVYVYGRDGRVLCARLDTIPYLRRQQITAARERLHLPPRNEADAIRENAGAPATDKVDSARSDPLRSERDRKP